MDSPDWSALAARYGGQAPRYTSYPTAVQFSDAVDGDLYRRWLTDLDPAEPVGLYVHVPFCDRLCWFCGCNTRVVHRRATIDGFCEHLVGELALVEKALSGRLKVNDLHLGGGTPNMLSRDNLTDVFAALRHVFRLSPNCAIAAEMDPAILTEEWVRAACFHGLTRASLGVQDLSPAVQAAVNRLLDFDQLARCVGWLRAGGVESINFDLMYGLPKQGLGELMATIDKVLPLKPDRLALFGYAHVPWVKPHQNLIHRRDLPGPEQRLEQAEAAAERLIAEGYVRIGLDHFALSSDGLAQAGQAGRLHRNFQGYSCDPGGALIGLGPSAIGSLPAGQAQNLTAEAQWRAAIDVGRLPTARGLIPDAEDRFRGEIIERLMCDFAADLGQIAERHGRPLEELNQALERLGPMVADGLVRFEGHRIRITGHGQPFVRTACMAFDTHLPAPGEQRHAAAV
jgi:oxygen-independent coproporphyrinogen-3 oxidase